LFWMKQTGCLIWDLNHRYARSLSKFEYADTNNMCIFVNFVIDDVANLECLLSLMTQIIFMS
jgi:hypothetical protein